MARPKLTYGQRLRAWRTAAGLTQTQAAERVGVTQPTWSDWETGSAEPCGRNLVRIERLTRGACAVAHLVAA